MSREFAKAFYHSKAWKDTRERYYHYQHGLCERCARALKAFISPTAKTTA